MEFKEFEEKLSNINNQIFAFFLQIEEEEKGKINEVFGSLKQNLGEKNQILESFERQIKADEERHGKEIGVIEQSIQIVKGTPMQPIHDLAAKKAESEAKKAEEQKNALLVIRRMRSEMAHRINSLNKELTVALKERTVLLDEEEKNFKNREAELVRRENIDLSKTNEANIKEYGELEKSLLDINDAKGIAEVKKKILGIRARGLADQETIKNKYEFQIFENILEFKRYYEKIVLENSLISEDYSLKIKALEKQRDESEAAENLKCTLACLDLDQAYLELEKAELLHEIEFQKEIFDREMVLKEEILGSKTDHDASKNRNVLEYHKFASETDRIQFETYKPMEAAISVNVKKECDFVLGNLSEVAEIFQANLLSIVAKTWETKKRLRQDLSRYLVISLKDDLTLIKPNYLGALATIEKECLEYYKLQNKRFTNFLKAIENQTKALLGEIKNTMDIFLNYYHDEQMFRKTMDKKIFDELDRGFQGASEAITADHDKAVSNQHLYAAAMKKARLDFATEMAEKTEKILRNHSEGQKQLSDKIKQADEDQKTQLAKNENDYLAFQRSSKNKVSELKSSFNDNLVFHERDLDKKYKASLLKNQKERKAKIRSL